MRFTLGTCFRRWDYRCRAFTLTGLVAVVTCVGLMITIVFPSLDAAVGRSRQALCLERLRAIGQASLIYSERDIFNAAIPVHRLQFQQDPADPSFIGAYEWGGKSGIGRSDSLGGAGVTNSQYGTFEGFGPATRPLNEIMYGHRFPDYAESRDRVGAISDSQLNLDKFRCPADDGPPLGREDGTGPHCPDWIKSSGRSSFDHFGNSYAANLFMIGASGGGEMLSNSPYLRPQSRVPHPARTIYYEENIGRWAWAARRELDDCQWIGQGVDPGPSGAVRGWHGKDWIFNRAFGDAHAERQTVYNEGTEDAEGYATHYRNEQLAFYPQITPCCESTDLDCKFSSGGDFEQYRCIIVRGDGWQKDTMPAPPVQTGLVPRHPGRPSYEGCVTPQ